MKYCIIGCVLCNCIFGQSTSLYRNRLHLLNIIVYNTISISQKDFYFKKKIF